MSITDELRKYAQGFKNSHDAWSGIGNELDAIADRIDAEHERVTMEMRNRGWNNGYDEGFASADDWLDQHEDAMAEHGWIRLPVDADGEYIHIGDAMEWCDSGDTLEVVGIGDDCLFYLDGEEAEWTAARNKRHHHAPTVEDVLDEIVDKANAIGVAYASNDMSGDEMMDALHAIIVDYAAKLRLREDA